MAKSKKPCWNPGLFPNCQDCKWLLYVWMKVGKKFQLCHRPEAKQMRVWLTENQLAAEVRQHATRMAGLTNQLRKYKAALESQKGKRGGSVGCTKQKTSVCWPTCHAKRGKK